jgi:hypothetical protein
MGSSCDIDTYDESSKQPDCRDHKEGRARYQDALELHKVRVLSRFVEEMKDGTDSLKERPQGIPL